MEKEVIELFTEDGKVYTTSRQIAKDFGKEHSSVLKTIEGENRKGKHIQGVIDEILASGNPLTNYFIKTTYINRGKQYPEYKLTKDGFTLLAMGFTGVDALKFKIEYINRFNEMETQLKEIENIMNTKNELSEDEYAEIKFSTSQRVKNTFFNSADIFKDYERFITYSRKSMDTKKRVKRLNQIIETLKTKEDNLYITKTKGYRAERENIIELKEEILRDINELTNRSYGQKLGYANRKII